MSIDDTNAHFIIWLPGGERYIDIIVVLGSEKQGSTEVVIKTNIEEKRVHIK